MNLDTTLNADLHCHSVVSDGTLTPEALAERAAERGVRLWSLTDHDEIGGQARAIAAAQAHGMAYLTGTEIWRRMIVESSGFWKPGRNHFSVTGVPGRPFSLRMISSDV